ncbi:MAG: 23S rRNA (uracil(1939)-C(5))-methyltransferase RlmD [Clostridia bacterium]|nr:23S rRNA (uracil(1939)-C(5))-methyltransferase RlmD [Clostridia bacterium]
MIKNGEYEGIVEGLGTDGEGIIKVEGTTAFVPFCLVGERVRFKALKVKGNVAYGKVIEVLQTSPARVQPQCPVFGKCGGCNLQHAAYSAQLDFKRESVKTALKKIGGIDCEVSPCVPCEKEYGYRNKLVLPIGTDGEGNTVVGFYASHSHRIVPTDGCAIQSAWVADVIEAVKQFVNLSGLKGYDDTTGKGELRHIVVREIKGKFIFALVATKEINAQKLISAIAKKFESFTFLLNINSKSTNAVFGDRWKTLHGEGFFEAEEGGIKYSAGVNTFLQVNDGVRAKLYSQVLDEADLGAVALDLYSGGGMLTAMLAKKCGTAYGIEVVEEASHCADELKEKNGLDGKMFNICGTVEGKLDGVMKATAGKKRIIVCDPPRKGMERSVVRAIASANADKIVLISCNPATLARDLGLLLGTVEEVDGKLLKTSCGNSEYAIDSVTPYDMFPQTKWCETLVVLSKKA